MRALARVFHVELRQFPHSFNAFNVDDAGLWAIVEPWVNDRVFEAGEERWNPPRRDDPDPRRAADPRGGAIDGPWLADGGRARARTSPSACSNTPATSSPGCTPKRWAWSTGTSRRRPPQSGDRASGDAQRRRARARGRARCAARPGRRAPARRLAGGSRARSGPRPERGSGARRTRARTRGAGTG